MYPNQKSFKKNHTSISMVKFIEPHAKRDASPSEEDMATTRFSSANSISGQENRIAFLNDKAICTDYITGKKQLADPETLKGNIENYIGMAQIPIGLAGPLSINGDHANGDFFIPMATTEGALVASYNRGMKACRLSGGITSMYLSEGLQRSPFFKFKTLRIAQFFVSWIKDRIAIFETITSTCSRYAQLQSVKPNIEGNSVILHFEYTTGDASGQNMVTICTDKICRYILKHFNFSPTEWYIESNFSGDKKARASAFSSIRGRKVVSEIVLPKNVVQDTLKSSPEQIVKYWQASTLALIQSGAVGAQGHIANGLTALFIACGQDVACISESFVGLTRMELTSDGNLYASLSLPSLMVGTVGGGTGLPTQNEALQMMDCAGAKKVRKFAEICCAVALTGEISIAAAMSVDHFTQAHQSLGRKK